MAAQELFTTSLFSDPNLVSYWRFEGDSTDSKGANNGTDTSITYGAGTGKFGQGAGFNASTDKIVVGVTGWPTGANVRTMHCWLKPSPLEAGIPHAYFYYGAFSSLAMFGIVMFTGGGIPKLQVDCFGGGGSQVAIADPTLAFHMIDAVYNGTQVLTYYDGALVDTTSATLNTTGAAGAFGQDPGSNHHFVSSGSGVIDDAAIFSRVLSATEISNLFNGSTGGTSNFLNLLGVGT